MAEARKRARELQAEAVEGADEILPIREHTQFYVQRELAALGIEAWVGRKVDFIRRGKNRFAEAIESPVLPNYVFVEMTPQQFIKAQGVKYLAPTFQMVPRQEVERVKQFQRLVEASYEAAQRVDANSRASVAEYKRGASLRVVSGPFRDMLATFERMVNSPDAAWDRVEATIDGIGGKVRFDPLDVREAG